MSDAGRQGALDLALAADALLLPADVDEHVPYGSLGQVERDLGLEQPQVEDDEPIDVVTHEGQVADPL